MPPVRCSFCGKGEADALAIVFTAPDGLGICETCVYACWTLIVAEHPAVAAALRATAPVHRFEDEQFHPHPDRPLLG